MRSTFVAGAALAHTVAASYAPEAPTDPIYHYQNYPAEETPAPTIPALKSKDWDDYWARLDLCDAEMELASCLLNQFGSEANNGDILNEKSIAKCSVDFVNDFCNGFWNEEVTYEYSPSTNVKGDIVEDDEEGEPQHDCQTAVFADSFLVYQKFITDVNSILGVSPALERSTVVKAHLALQITRTNADCVIKSFFGFINQYATKNFISENDIQCVRDYIEDEKCEFAEEYSDGWNIPAIINRYGLYGYEKIVDKVHDSFGEESQVSAFIGEIQRLFGSGSTQGLHYIDAQYDVNTQEVSIDVCPQNYVSINGAYEESGILGTAVDSLSFHFPKDANVSFGDKTVPADPIYEEEEEECHETCRAYFEFSKEHFEQVENGTLEAEHLTSRCFAIVGYEIFFIESGRSQPLSYEVKDGVTAGEGDDQCYKASWKETHSCSSHLTEWRMTASCCISYAEYYEANTPTEAPPTEEPDHYVRSLLEAEYPYHHHHEPEPVDPEPKIIHNIAKVDAATLMFFKTVTSKSSAGSISPVDSPKFSTKKPELVIQLIDAQVLAILKACDEAEYKSKFMEGVCEHATHHGDALETAIAEETESEVVLLAENYYPAPTTEEPEVVNTYEYVLEQYSYYVGDDYTATTVCSELNIKMDFEAVIPIVTGQCFPQACMLSQLASCMEQPEAEYTYEPETLPDYHGHYYPEHSYYPKN